MKILLALISFGLGIGFCSLALGYAMHYNYEWSAWGAFAFGCLFSIAAPFILASE